MRESTHWAMLQTVTSSLNVHYISKGPCSAAKCWYLGYDLVDLESVMFVAFESAVVTASALFLALGRRHVRTTKRSLCTMSFIIIKSTRRILCQSLVRSFLRSHRSLIHLLRTARSARALRSRAPLGSLTHSGAHDVYEINASILCRFNPMCAA